MSSCGAVDALQRSNLRLPGRLSRRLRLTCASAFKARWSLDVKFGSKAEASGLLQEWVGTVGAAAGLSPTTVSLTTGSVGAPESTLELEACFDSLAELESFWSAIPQQQHKAWGQRMQQYIVHGSPQWRVYRCIPAFPETMSYSAAADQKIGGMAAAARSAAANGRTASTSSGSNEDGSTMPGADERQHALEAGPPSIPSIRHQTASGLSVVSSEDEVQEVLDWKGEPMKINPKDKLPFKFL